ncbi:MAG: ABC transporter permease, partial [Clostridia bacterium]|nr:ABC transporter permease [Clostridia bacterium]
MKKTQHYSRSHRDYLRKYRTNNLLVIITQISILVAIILSWELLTKYEIISSFFFSSPSKIINTISELLRSGELIYHANITLSETLIGFAIATGIGFGVAFVLWYSDFLRRVSEPYLVVLNSLPKIALGPIIIIWFGAGQKAIIFMCVLIVIIVTIMNILNSFTSCDHQLIALAKSMGANKWQIFTKLILPNSLKDIVATLKINVGLSCGTVKLCRLVKVFKPYYTMSKPSHFYKKSHLSNKNLLGFPNRFFNIL